MESVQGLESFLELANSHLWLLRKVSNVEEENDEDMAEEGKFPMNTICCY